MVNTNLKIRIFQTTLLEIWQPISKSDANKFDIDHGVKIISLKNEEIERTYGVGDGDIILAVEDQKVSNAQEVDQLLKKYQNKDYFELQILTQKWETRIH